VIAFTAKSLFTPHTGIDQPLVLIEDGRIARMGPRAELEVPANAAVTDFGDCILTPGFVDIHIHGAAGHDVMQTDSGGRRGMECFLAHCGVTSYYPTTVTAPLDKLLSALEHLATAIDSATENEPGNRAQALGIHIEGPFLSHARRGVHPPEDLVTPSVKVFDKLWQAARGHIRIMTIAPELECAVEVISEANKRGVSVSLGHSDADLNATREGVTAGARHATHTFNALRPLDHREPGILGEILSNSRLTADVIADGIHVHPTMIEVLFRAKGVENMVLITDGISATGMPDGRYQLGSLEVELRDGKCVRDGKLAGSVLTMDRAVQNCMQFAHLDLQQSVRAATLNPARVAGADKKGILEPGVDADFVVLTASGEVRATMVGGVIVQ